MPQPQTQDRFLDFRFRRQGCTVDRFGELDFRGGSTLHTHQRDRRGWIVREGPAQGHTTTAILEISEDGRRVRPIKGTTVVLWTKRHGSTEDISSYRDGSWIPADEIDYLLLQVLESEWQILVDTNPVVRDLHDSDRGRYSNTRNLSFRQPFSRCPSCSSRFQVDP